MAPPTLTDYESVYGQKEEVYGSDWLSRIVIPDVYPRKSDPWVPAVSTPQVLPPGAPAVPPPAMADIYAGLTQPGQRPYSYQRAVNINVNVAITPTPLVTTKFECDTMLINVPSTAANSVFFGFGSGVSTTSGEEIRAGNPQAFQPDNTREQWELQRPLEMICIMLATALGFPTPGPYRPNRVVFDASDWFLIAAAPTTVSVMLFYIPEAQ